MYLCAGFGSVAVVLGSHFKFRGFAAAYHVLIPAGVRGMFPGVSFSAAQPRPRAARLEQPARERGKPSTEKPAPSKERGDPDAQ